MRQINRHSHEPFLRDKLRSILAADEVSIRLWKSIGNYLDGVFDISEYEEFNYRYFFPVRTLFEWIAKDGGLTFDELTDENLEIRDDEGAVVAVSRFDSIPAVSQMVSLGLWFLECELNLMGPATEADYDANRINPNGWTELSVIEHQGECLLNAYQALSYAERLQRKVVLSTDERAHISMVDFSKLGKRGSDVRHGPNRELKKWTIARYQEGSWEHVNEAAFELMDAVIDHGRTIGVTLVRHNAQTTIAKWISKSLLAT